MPTITNKLLIALVASVSLTFVACADDAKTSTCSTSSTSQCTSSSSSSGVVLPEGDLQAVVTKYEYTFDVATGESSSRLSLDVAADGGNCWEVPCALDAVSDITWNDAASSSASVSNNTLRACGPGVTEGPTLIVGSQNKVPSDRIYLNLDIGYASKTNLAGGKFNYMLSWVGGCDYFGPCDDDPSRLSSFHFDVKHSATDVVLCPGKRVAGTNLTTCDVDGAPTYSAFAIAYDSMWQPNAFGKFAGVDTVFYEVPGGKLAQSLDAASVGAFMDWITGLLGQFPYGDELRIGAGPTAWYGFEHPANIILYDKLDSAQGGFKHPTMHVLMHEIIHQWAGDRTTLATATDFVWKEAIAEYLTYVFEDEARPVGEAIATRTYWDSIWQQSKYFPRPTDEPAPQVSGFYGDVYGPGPMVLYLQLEPLIGRAAVLQGIQSFLSTPGARSVNELKDALAQASGKNLDAYFDAWVFGQGKPEWPTFEITTNQVGSEVQVSVTQKNLSGKLYGCAVEVRLVGATQSAPAIVDFGLAPTDATATTMVTLNEPVVSTVLDPDRRLIGWNAKAPPIVVHRPVWIF